MSLFGFFQIRCGWLPIAQMFQDLLQAGDVMPNLLGMVSGHTYYYNTRTAESSWTRPAGAISTPVHTHASVPAAAQMLDFSQPMDKSVVGRIIGTRGVNIKAVESTSGCKVFRQVPMHVPRQPRRTKPGRRREGERKSARDGLHPARPTAT